MPSVLMTGANRGLGFGLVKLYAVEGWRVFACCRDPNKAKGLNELAAKSSGKVTVHAVDIENHASIDALALQIKGQPIDVLLNVAGYRRVAKIRRERLRRLVTHLQNKCHGSHENV